MRDPEGIDRLDTTICYKGGGQVEVVINLCMADPGSSRDMWDYRVLCACDVLTGKAQPTWKPLGEVAT